MRWIRFASTATSTDQTLDGSRDEM
jgi:hypothetical protein